MDSGASTKGFQGLAVLSMGTPASTGHCPSNPNKSWEEMTWMRTFGFLAKKTRFRSSLMAHEFVLDLLSCSGPQNTQVSLSETLQMFHFKDLAEIAGGSCRTELLSEMCSNPMVTTTPEKAHLGLMLFALPRPGSGSVQMNFFPALICIKEISH